MTARKRTSSEPAAAAKPARKRSTSTSSTSEQPSQPKRARKPRQTRALRVVDDAASVTLEPQSESLLAVVDRAVQQMPWLGPSDAALIEVARQYARTIDEAPDDAERAKRIGWTGPHLVNTLKALGGAPQERRALQAESQIKGKLAQLRAARGAG